MTSNQSLIIFLRNQIILGNRHCKNTNHPKYYSRNFPICLIRLIRHRCTCSDSCVIKTLNFVKSRYNIDFRSDCNWNLKNLFDYDEFFNCYYLEEGEVTYFKLIHERATEERLTNYLQEVSESFNSYCTAYNRPLTTIFNRVRCAKSMIISISRGNKYTQDYFYSDLMVLTKCVPENYLKNMWTDDYPYMDRRTTIIDNQFFSIFITPDKLKVKRYWKAVEKKYALRRPDPIIKIMPPLPRLSEDKVNYRVINDQYSLLILTVCFITILGLITSLSKTRYKSTKFYILLVLIILSLTGQLVVINI